MLQAVGRIESVRAVATIGAPFDPQHVTHLFADSSEVIESQGKAEVRLAGRTFTVSREFVHDLADQHMEEAVGGLGRPLLIFHSPEDQVVGIESAAKIYQAARHPKSFVSLDDADHLLLKERDSLYVGSVLAAWASRYIENQPEPDAPEKIRDDSRVVARTAAGSFRTEILAHGRSLVADEPTAVGGEDLGPSPYDLLAAALGACTTMTLRMYADRKNWPLDEAVARIRHTKIYAEDREDVESGEPRLDRIEQEIELVGELDPDQRARLLEIAGRCPVHRTLRAGVHLETAPADLD